MLYFHMTTPVSYTHTEKRNRLGVQEQTDIKHCVLLEGKARLLLTKYRSFLP